jgi:N-acylneuraminate cytidylyltransferase
MGFIPYKTNMKVISIIPARGGSKGIPDKNIMDFCGHPLINWTIWNCIQSEYISDIYVSSDSESILDSYFTSRHNKIHKIKRPIELAQDDSSSEDAILHVLEGIKEPIDYVVFPQVTSPLRHMEDIDEAIDKIIEDGTDSLFSVNELKDFCVWDDKGNSVTYDYKKRGIRQEKKPYYLENGSIYVFKPEIFKHEKNRLCGSRSMYFMPFWKSYEIDTMEDIEICQYYMEKKLGGGIVYE